MTYSPVLCLLPGIWHDTAKQGNGVGVWLLIQIKFGRAELEKRFVADVSR